MRTRLRAIIIILIISSMPGPIGSAQALNQRRSRTKPSRAALAAVEAECFKGVMNSLAVKMPLLQYPREAMKRGIGGKVTIKVFVNEKGVVYYAMAVDGPPILRKPALKSAREAEFPPFKRDDQPIKCTGLLVYTFNAPKRS
jgi:outer membrane biosynthesis protein TonB